MANTDQTKSTIRDTHQSLRQAVKKALEHKRKLGQYSVIWRENQIIIDGQDAPKR